MASMDPRARYEWQLSRMEAHELESLGGIGGVSVNTEGHIILANFNKYVWKISPERDVQVLADNLTATSGNTILGNGDILQADFETQPIRRIGLVDGDVEIFSDERGWMHRLDS